MAVTYPVRGKEGWHVSPLRRLRNTERSDDTGLLPNTRHGRMYRLDGRRYDTFDFGRNHSTRVPFELNNAPGMFQCAMSILLKKVKSQFALVYLDDVVIFSRTLDEHKEHAQQALMLSNDEGVTLNLQNCECFNIHIDYLAMLFAQDF